MSHISTDLSTEKKPPDVAKLGTEKKPPDVTKLGTEKWEHFDRFMRKKRAIFSSVPKKMLEMLEFLHKHAKLCSFCTQIGIETGLVSSI